MGYIHEGVHIVFPLCSISPISTGFKSTKGRECRGRGWLAKFFSIEYATKLTVDQLRCFFHRLLEHCDPFSLFLSYSASDDAISQDAIVAAGIRRLRP